ncbi:MAG: tRNA-dihydrouridine synthase [Patescibacteria group bacterium]
MNNKDKNLGFWQKLARRCQKEKRPIMCLAPMSDVTDEAFRQMFVKYGRPDVLWTEFVSAAGLCSRGYDNMLIDLKFKSNEHPIVAQIFGSNPKHFFKSAQILAKLGFDGIDINMGCPDRKVEKQGAGAALMKNPKLAQEIILATKQGAPKLPVSVKTRIGYYKNEIETWLPALLAAKPAVITVHGRTRKEMSQVPANWDIIGRAAEIVKASKSKTLIIGNGDVVDLADAYQKAERYQLDGIMIGRAAFGNPWFFRPLSSLAKATADKLNPPLSKRRTITLEDKLKVMAEHAKLFEKLYKNDKSFNVMKKHFKAYAAGFDGAKELRIKLMKTKTAKEVLQAVKEWQKKA